MLDDSAYADLCSALTLQSNENGFFRNMADDMVEMAGPEWLRHFAALRCDRDRVAECVTDSRIKDLVRHMMDNVCQVYRGKSATVSKQRRLEAEHLYSNGEPDRALLMFTQSVVKAPSAEVEEAANSGSDDDGHSLALALWGRSAIFYERRQMLRCLEDVKLSLRQRLPQELRLQAYSRMADCYASLGRLDEARIASSIVTRLSATGDDQPSGLRHTQRRRQPKATVVDAVPGEKKNGRADGTETGIGTKTRTGTGTGTESETEATTALAGGEHPRLRRVSSKLALAQTNRAGRFFVAAQPIRTGDTLVVEDAYVSCLSDQRFGSHCHHCMRRLETAMPCPECSAVAFCGPACANLALDSYHKFECRYLDLLIGSGMSILCFAALRVVTQQSVAYFESAANLDDQPEDGDHPYGRIYRMVGHDQRRCPEDYFRRTLMAIFLTSVLMKSGYFGANVRRARDTQAVFGNREMLIARVLLRNLEVLQFNAHEISEPIGVGNASSTATIGVGLYASASFFNHECFPAVTRFFRGRTLVVRAVRPVEKERVVGDCYGPAYEKFDRDERRRRLRARYWFECECEACLRDWPPAQKLGHTLRVRCGRCGAVIDEAASTNKKGGRCAKCGADTALEYEAASRQVDDLRARLEEAAAAMTPQPHTVQRICDTVDALHRRVPPPHHIYRRAADALTRYWSQPQPQPAQPCSSVEPTSSNRNDQAT